MLHWKWLGWGNLRCRRLWRHSSSVCQSTDVMLLADVRRWLPCRWLLGPVPAQSHWSNGCGCQKITPPGLLICHHKPNFLWWLLLLKEMSQSANRKNMTHEKRWHKYFRSYWIARYMPQDSNSRTLGSLIDNDTWSYFYFMSCILFNTVTTLFSLHALSHPTLNSTTRMTRAVQNFTMVILASQHQII
jgi:hypothetical protein